MSTLVLVAPPTYELELWFEDHLLHFRLILSNKQQMPFRICQNIA